MFGSNAFGWIPFAGLFPRRIYTTTGGAVSDLVAGGNDIPVGVETGGAVSDLVAGGAAVFVQTIFVSGGGRPSKPVRFPIHLPKVKRIKYPEWVNQIGNDDSEVLEILAMEE